MRTSMNHSFQRRAQNYRYLLAEEKRVEYIVIEIMVHAVFSDTVFIQYIKGQMN